MEKNNPVSYSTMDTELWTSPGDNYPKVSNVQKELMDSPNLSSSPSHLDSDGSKQDSGYCSLTPQDSDSFNSIFDKPCPICGKQKSKFSISTPHCSRCDCWGDYLSTITESKLPPYPLQTQARQSTSNEIFEEALDSSLYPEEMETDGDISGETEQNNLGQMEIGDERSIDFTKNEIFLSSTTPNFMTDCGKSGLEESKAEESFFTPEAEMSGLIFGMSNPNMRNETTPNTEMPIETFLSIAKKISVANQVIKIFKLTGIEKLDFFYQLGEKMNCPTIISKILSYIPSKDLRSVRAVSKLWKKIVREDAAAFERVKLYNSVMRMKRENCYSPSKKRSMSSRLAMCNITNQTSPGASPRQSPRLSPTSPVTPENARFHSYKRAARKLKPGERLLQCPKCYFPSHDRGSPTAQCSRSGCRHRFCVHCRSETPPDLTHNCPPLYTPVARSLNKVERVGSKEFKKRMRRLNE